MSLRVVLVKVAIIFNHEILPLAPRIFRRPTSAAVKMRPNLGFWMGTAGLGFRDNLCRGHVKGHNICVYYKGYPKKKGFGLTLGIQVYE